MKIALLGHGVVGQGVEKIIVAHPEYNIEIGKILMLYKQWCTQDNMTADYNEIIEDPSISTVVECIGGLEPAHSYCIAALKAGKNYISSNKKMVAHFYKEIAQVAQQHHVTFRLSAAVGGGIPWIEQLNSIKQRESISGFEGIMNGTSNYILDQMDAKGTSFADALQQAQQLGYAEQDPSEDIDGIDTANKTVLSANIAFDGIYSIDDMLIKGIRYISQKEAKYCKDNEYRCILRGVGKKVDDQVGIAVYPYFASNKSLLGSIRENNNCLSVDSCYLGTLSLVGQGAGRFPTASNMVADVLRIKDGISFKLNGQEKKNYDEILEDNFYIRTTDLAPFEAVEKEMIDQESFIVRQLSVKALRELLEKSLDKELFIAGVK